MKTLLGGCAGLLLLGDVLLCSRPRAQDDERRWASTRKEGMCRRDIPVFAGLLSTSSTLTPLNTAEPLPSRIRGAAAFASSDHGHQHALHSQRWPSLGILDLALTLVIDTRLKILTHVFLTISNRWRVVSGMQPLRVCPLRLSSPASF